MIGLVRAIRARRAQRRRLEASLGRPHPILLHEGLRVDLAALARGLLAEHDLAGAEALIADPTARLATAILRFAKHDKPVPGLLGVVCARCGTEYASLRIAEQTNGFAFTYEGRCPVGHPLPALPPYTVYV